MFVEVAWGHLSSAPHFTVDLKSVFRLIDLLGVFMNGILGGRLAREKGFDFIGFAVLAVMSALAGGIIRDVLLQHGPPIALTDKYYLYTALAGATFAFLWSFNGKWSLRALLICDATVLGTWAATGASKTLSLGFGIMPAILLGIITAIGGGMVRDIAAGNVPAVFGGNSLYATPAAVSAIIDVVFFECGLSMLGMVLATLVGASFTVLAHWRQWRLPSPGTWTISMTPMQWRQMQRERRKQRQERDSSTDSPINLKSDSPEQLRDNDGSAGG